MEIFARTFTITAEVNIRKQASKKMPVRFSPVLTNELKMSAVVLV